MSTEPTTPEEWIEHNRAQREAEGLSRADAAMLQALAEATIQEKLERMWISPGNEKGRCHSHFEGEPGPATVKWNEMLAANKQKRVVKGGPLIGQEF